MATITIRLDDNTKNNFVRACDNMGLDMTSAMMIYIKKVSRENKIPFEISYEPFYSESNMNYLNQSIEQLKQGKVIVKTMAELEAMENE